METIYEVRVGDGRVVGFDTYGEAVDWCRGEWEDAEIGHDGDLTSGGDRTLVWSSEADSVDDDGARAVASIYAHTDRAERVVRSLAEQDRAGGIADDSYGRTGDAADAVSRWYDAAGQAGDFGVVGAIEALGHERAAEVYVAARLDLTKRLSTHY